jgi:hypothetical protein
MSRGTPVSSKVLRPARIAGQLFAAAAMNLEFG